MNQNLRNENHPQSITIKGGIFLIFFDAKIFREKILKINDEYNTKKTLDI